MQGFKACSGRPTGSHAEVLSALAVKLAGWSSKKEKDARSDLTRRGSSVITDVQVTLRRYTVWYWYLVLVCFVSYTSHDVVYILFYILYFLLLKTLIILGIINSHYYYYYYCLYLSSLFVSIIIVIISIINFNVMLWRLWHQLHAIIVTVILIIT